MKKIYLLFAFLIIAGGSYYVTKNFMNHQQDEEQKPVIDTTTVILPTDSDSIVEQKDTDSIIKPVVPDPPTPDPKPVNISLSDVKSLIQNGKYENDRRISRSYKIEYVDVNDDDIDGLQQNLTFVQQQVDYENWRDFDVVGIGFDSNGRVNLIKIQPVY